MKNQHRSSAWWIFFKLGLNLCGEMRKEKFKKSSMSCFICVLGNDFIWLFRTLLLLFSLFLCFAFCSLKQSVWSSWLLLFFSRDNPRLTSHDPSPREGLRIDRALPNLLAALECSVLPFQVLINNPTKKQITSKLVLCFAINLELSRPFVFSKFSIHSQNCKNLNTHP